MDMVVVVVVVVVYCYGVVDCVVTSGCVEMIMLKLPVLVM